MGGSSIDNQMVMFVMELVREEIYILCKWHGTCRASCDSTKNTHFAAKRDDNTLSIYSVLYNTYFCYEHIFCDYALFDTTTCHHISRKLGFL